jgi:hypothetical protein
MILRATDSARRAPPRSIWSTSSAPIAPKALGRFSRGCGVVEKTLIQ